MNVLAMGIILLFILTSVSTMGIGFNDKTMKREGFLDDLAFYCYDASGSNAKYEYYKEQILKDYSKEDIEIIGEKVSQPKASQPIELPQTSISSGPMDSAWPKFCHDVRNTGRSPYGASGNVGKEKWNFRIESIVPSSPAIDKNGSIYIGSGDGCLYAIFSNGTEKWRFETNGWVESSPAIAADGTLYVGSNDGHLYAIYPNGTKKWRFGVGDWVFSSPAIGEDGIIYFGVTGPGWDKGRLYAVNPNGTEKWRYDTGFWIYSSPSLDSNGTIYIGSHDYYLYAINSNGTLKWRYKTGGEVKSAPAIGDDGTIYVGSWDDFLYAVYPNGTLKWKFDTGDATETSPTIAQDGTIYVGSINGKIFSVDPDGNENWRFQTGDWILSSPAIDKNGIIYVGSLDGNLYVLNPDGSLRWKFATGGEILSSPSIGEEGTVYFAADFSPPPGWHRYLYAIEVIENEPPDKPNIDGPISGKPRTEYTYIAVTNDPDGDNVSYFFDWDDGTNSGWTEFVPSGTPVNATHKWWIMGVYNVKVKAKDPYESESEWGELEVTMPKNQQTRFTWFLQFLQNHPRMFPIIRHLLGWYAG